VVRGGVEGKLILYFAERVADNHEKTDGAKEEPVTGDDHIDRFRAVFVDGEVADVAAFYFIDSQEKDNEDDRVDKRLLELHDIGF
jgi:hypothetical protein